MKFRRITIVTLLTLLWSPLMAQKITVDSAEPSSTVQGTANLNVTIKGRGFAAGSKAAFLVTGTDDASQVGVNNTIFIDSRTLVANIDVDDAAVISNYDIAVTSNGRTGKGIEKFAVTEKGGSAAIPMQTTHFAEYDIAPDNPNTSYSSNTPGTTITLDGTTYNMIQQCPMDSGICTQAFTIFLIPDPANPADCPVEPIDLTRARMTIWVNNLLECGPFEADPPVVCGEPYFSTARAQIRELDDSGGVLEGGSGMELHWDHSVGGTDVEITANSGSWDVSGLHAVTITGKGRKKTTCGYGASFRLTTRPAP